MMEGEDDTGSNSFDQQQAQCKLTGHCFVLFRVSQLSRKEIIYLKRHTKLYFLFALV